MVVIAGSGGGGGGDGEVVSAVLSNTDLEVFVDAVFAIAVSASTCRRYLLVYKLCLARVFPCCSFCRRCCCCCCRSRSMGA